MATCYLDFDGVLHHANVVRASHRRAWMAEPGHALFEWAPVLADALVPYPGVRIVLSTSWVRLLGYDRARGYLPYELRQRVVGATFHRREHCATRSLEQLWLETARGVQVARDIERRRACRWFAIDDSTTEFLPSQREWLVACDSSTGLGAHEAKRQLSAVLRKVHAAPADHTS